MEYYMKWETFVRNVSTGKGVTVFEANNLPDALRISAGMMEHPSVTVRPLEKGVENRITVGPVVPSSA